MNTTLATSGPIITDDGRQFDNLEGMDRADKAAMFLTISDWYEAQVDNQPHEAYSMVINHLLANRMAIHCAWRGDLDTLNITTDERRLLPQMIEVARDEAKRCYREHEDVANLMWQWYQILLTISKGV